MSVVPHRIVTYTLAAITVVVSAQASDPTVPLSVVSLNLAKKANTDVMVREIRSVERVRKADLYLFQEVVQPDGSSSVAEEMAHKLNMHAVFAPCAPGNTNQGLAILSRYPLRDREVLPLKQFNLTMRSRTRIALAVTMVTPFGPVRVINTHLDSRINADQRIEQLAPVVEASQRFSGYRIVGGDLNTNPFVWVGHVLPVRGKTGQGTAVRQLMASNGYTTPFTSGATHDFLGMQLDWVFFKDLQTRASGAEVMKFSDHHAVWAEFLPR